MPEEATEAFTSLDPEISRIYFKEGMTHCICYRRLYTALQ